MNGEKWEQIKEIFQAALDRAPDERGSFLSAACEDDDALRREVEILLSSFEDADDDQFMQRGAIGEVAELIAARENKLETGKCLGHYEIIEQIGAGGMGEVYLTKDKRLNREVAVKILNEKFSQDQSNLNRFIQEAKAASALNHPNILTIYDFGESDDTHYIVSEFVKGRTLREFLNEKTVTLSEVLDISIQVAGALCSAHEAGLVHRDIKPENIMIRPDGYVKILDFGLAKLIEQKNKSIFESDTSGQNETAKGVILGTVNYMSPEQAKGERIDERTDVFSLGSVVYEMIAGRAPFTSDSAPETFANLIKIEPPPLSGFSENVPEEMQLIVSKMLRKNKDERYPAMKDVFADLKDLREDLALKGMLEKSHSRIKKNVTAALHSTTGNTNLQTAETRNGLSRTIKRHKPLAAVAFAAVLIGAVGLGYYFFYARKTAAGTEGKKSIAVLPLKPINTTNRDEIYEVGIADSLILRLSSMRGFIVRPLSAIRKYVDIQQDPIVAGREQQVDYVLATNYQLAGGKIRVTSQLFNVETGQIEETYKSEKDTADVFAMEDAVARDVENILSARFVTALSGTAMKRRTTNEEAYRLYLQGMYLYDKRNGADARKAVEMLEQAVQLDPNYAQAWAGIAHAHRYVANLGRSTDIHEEYQKSIEAIEKALALDPDSAEAHSALCENKMYYEYDFDGAERECRRAVELGPNSALAHQVYSRYMMIRGRPDEAIAEAKIAIDLEPTSLFNQRIYGNSSYFARRYGEAVTQLKRVIAMDPNFLSAYPWLWQSLEMQGKYSEAYEWFMKFQELRRADEQTIQSYRRAYQESGWKGVLLEESRRFEDQSDAEYYRGAILNARIGNKDKAFEFLERSYQRRELWVSLLNVEPCLDSLRDDPRFSELVRRVGL